MSYGGNYNNAEFNWNYSSQPSGQGMSGYSQMNAMNQGGYGAAGYGGGRQWLHSNQSQSHQYQQNTMEQSNQDPFSSNIADYNQSMMSYTNFPKTAMNKSNMYGMGQGMEHGMGMGVHPRSAGGAESSYASYRGGSNNGLNNPSSRSQGQGGQGYNASWF